MRHLVLAALGAAVVMTSSPALASSPTLTVSQIPCEAIDYGDATAHSSAVLACVDAQDGVTLRLHDDGVSQWLEVGA